MGTQQVTTFQTAFFNPADFVIPDEELKSQLQLNDEQLKGSKNRTGQNHTLFVMLTPLQRNYNMMEMKDTSSVFVRCTVFIL